MTGAVIVKAFALAESDNPRDGDTRSPAARRGEALADVCGFSLDYQNREVTDPDADAPVVPKKRNWPQLIGVTTTERSPTGRGPAPRRAPHRPCRPRRAVLHRAAQDPKITLKMQPDVTVTHTDGTTETPNPQSDNHHSHGPMNAGAVMRPRCPLRAVAGRVPFPGR